MTQAPSLVPFALVATPDVLARGMQSPPVAADGGQSTVELSVDLASWPEVNQLDGELAHLAPEDAAALLADLLESFDEGSELSDALQGVVTQLQEVAAASARSPLLDPAAAHLGPAPRAGVNHLLWAGPVEPDALLEVGEAPSVQDSLLGAANPGDKSLVEPQLNPFPAPAASRAEAHSSIHKLVGLPEASPLALSAEPLPAGVVNLGSEQSPAVSTPAQLAAVVTPPSLAPALPVLPPMPEASRGARPGGPSLPDSVTVLGRSVRAASVAQAPTAGATSAGSFGAGTFDGTPWLMTSEGSQAPSLEGGIEERSSERAPQLRAHPAGRGAVTGDPVRTARSALSPSMTGFTVSSTEAQNAFFDAFGIQSTDVTRPALSAVRSSPLAARLSQAAHASVPEAPVTLSERPLSRVDLRVADGDRVLRLGVAREAEGYAVEVRAPRDVVAEIRDLEADVEAALREDGEDGLASFDASAEDEAFDGPELFEGEAEADVASTADTSPAVDPHRLLDRRA